LSGPVVGPKAPRLVLVSSFRNTIPLALTDDLQIGGAEGTHAHLARSHVALSEWQLGQTHRIASHVKSQPK